MKFLGPIFLFGGYCLIYAATAKGGVFATDPWGGVMADAYGVDTSGSGATATTGSAVSQLTPNPPNPLPSGTTHFTRPRINLPQRRPVQITSRLTSNPPNPLP